MNYSSEQRSAANNELRQSIFVKKTLNFKTCYYNTDFLKSSPRIFSKEFEESL